MMKPYTLALVSLALAILAGFVTGWLRHRPSRLTRGTQHILLSGTIVQLALIVAAFIFLLRGCKSA